MTQHSSQMKEEKKTRGRPKGATSFYDIQLKELNTLLPESSTIPVSRTWLMKLKSLGIYFINNKKDSSVEKNAEAEKVEMQLKK